MKKKGSRATTAQARFEAFAIGIAPRPRKDQLAFARKIARELFPGGAAVALLNKDRRKGPAPRDATITPAPGTRMPIGQAWDQARALAQREQVTFAEPLFQSVGLEPTIVAPHEAPAVKPKAKSFGGDKHLEGTKDVLWSLNLVRAPEAWALKPPAGGGEFGSGIVVGHPDTGYREHPEIWDTPPLRRRVRAEAGYDFENEDSDPVDPMDGSNAHGTSTASVIMSGRPAADETTVVGTAPAAELVPLRVGNGVVHWFSFKNVTQAIYHAVDRAGAHVISMSLGGPIHSDALERAVAHATERGVIVLAAAGNKWPFVVYPAKLDQVIAVAACNCLSKPWSDSAHGSAVDVTAPGESVWRAETKLSGGKPKYDISRSSGTSYAVATVAGACATWLAFHGRAALIARYGAARLPGVFRTVLTTAGVNRPAGWDTGDYGAGILDMMRLLQAPLPPASKLPKGGALFPMRSRTEDPVARIAAYFPDLTTAQVRAVLVRAVQPGVKSPAARSARMEELGPELAFHIATNPAVRARVHSQAVAARAKGKPKSQGPAANPFAAAQAQASPTLKAAIGASS